MSFALVTERKGTPTVSVVTASGTPAMVANSNLNRKVLQVQNQSSSVDVYIGPTVNVSTSLGFLIVLLATFEDLFSNSPWYVVTSGSDASVVALEVS